MAETSTKLGRVSLVPRGEYDPKAQYQRLDIVRYGGSSYLVLRDLQGAMPEDGEDYMLISEKGGKGDKGNPGDAAGFGAVSATVDDTSGTPSVDVTSTGPDTAKEFFFSFHGLKGEQGTEGEKGDTGEAGNGIASIERTSGTGAAGTTDTYTITMTDGSTATFQVYNGADGTGAGDMLKSVYDPQNKNTDIFSYVDKAVSGVEINVDADPTEGSPNPVSSGGTFSALATKQPKLTGAPGQAVGFGADGAAVAVPGWSQRNLVRNWYLPEPVNRLGVKSGELWGGNAHGLDGYESYGSNLTRWVRGEGVYLDSGANSILLQRMESNRIEGTGKWAFSVLIGASLYTQLLDVQQTDTVSSFEFNGIPFNLRTYIRDNGLFDIRVWRDGGTSGSLGPIIALKLEPGEASTLAYQDASGNWVLNDPPDYDLQYALCSLYSPITGEWVGSQHSNPNLLDNWYFADPVNQRGYTRWIAGSVSSSGAQENTQYGFMSGYSIDRWSIWTDSSTANAYIDSNGMHIDKYTFYQIIEPALIRYGKNYTLSVLIDDTLYTASGMISSTSSLIATFGLNLYCDSHTGEWIFDVRIYDLGGLHTVKAAKLELGPIQTLAHQDASGNWVLNDPPPNKALELAKCQKFLYKFHGELFSGVGINNRSWLTFMFPTEMRITPTIRDLAYNEIFGTPAVYNQINGQGVSFQAENPFVVTGFIADANL